MTLPGGGADKLGNRYEGFWTVHCMQRVMREEFDKIGLERPGEGNGIEFYLEKGSCREYHQVKLRSSGQWTLKLLHTEGVLPAFFDKLADPTSTCWFVSTNNAEQLTKLVERAKFATSVTEFLKDFAKAKDIPGLFGTLQTMWNCTPEIAWERLRRINIVTIDKDQLLRNVESDLAPLLDGNRSTIRVLLTDFVVERVHREVTAYEMWEYLKQHGIKRRAWHNDPHTFATVDKLNDQYLDRLRTSAIGGHWIERK